jgi:hypothetical protein
LDRVTTPHAIPADLLEFLRRSLHSVWALELLLLMRKNAERTYSPDELATDLRASLAVVLSILPQFAADGLVAEPERGRFAYRPADPVLAEKVDRLAVLYRESPVALVREIALAPNPKIQGFADAFKFRKE